MWRSRLFQRSLPPTSLFERGDRQLGLVREQRRGELHRVLHPHAAVAVGAVGAGEQRLRRRVVQVDVVLVGEEELDLAQRIAGAGALADAEVVDVGRRPVDRRGVDHPAARQQLHVLAGEIAGVGREMRRDLVLRDRGRHVPVRVDDDVLDLVGEDRGLVLGRADDDAGRVGDLVAGRRRCRSRRRAGTRGGSRGRGSRRGPRASSASVPCWRGCLPWSSRRRR